MITDGWKDNWAFVLCLDPDYVYCSPRFPDIPETYNVYLLPVSNLPLLQSSFNIYRQAQLIDLLIEGC